jgi:hypothetical protein
MKSLVECITTENGNRICKDEEIKSICFEHSEYDIICDVVSIEKCVLTKADDGRRCDFLFLFDKTKQEYNFLNGKSSIAYYVELKGIDLEDACEQLLNSIEKTKEELLGFEINALVVSSREFNPRYDNNEFNRSVFRIIKKIFNLKYPLIK